MSRLRILRDESGQAVIVVALCMVALMGFLGLAIDVGVLRYAKQNLQTAADAAALAAGMEIRVCGSQPNCPAMQAAAQKALDENGLTGSTLMTGCGSSPGSGLTLQINDPPCELGAADPNTGRTNFVEAVVSRREQTYFARFLGINNVMLSARAEASRNPNAPCIYALDPTGAGAISVLAAVGLQSKCGIVDESNSSAALTCLVGLLVSAPKIDVTGGTAGLLCGSTPPPRTHVPVPVPADPLAYLPPPPHASDPCPSSPASGNSYSGSSQQVNVGLLGNYVFNQGIYCGGISITAAVLMNVTFNPGIYILRQGPGGFLNLSTTGGFSITISALSSITGNGVLFYNQGSAGNIPGQAGGFSITAPLLSNISLSAATSGEYGGVLFMQAPQNTSPGSFNANLPLGSKLEGAIYLPNASVSYGISAISSAYNILVAKDINFDVPVLSRFGNNYATLENGSPLNGDDAVLVQ